MLASRYRISDSFVSARHRQSYDLLGFIGSSGRQDREDAARIWSIYLFGQLIVVARVRRARLVSSGRCIFRVAADENLVEEFDTSVENYLLAACVRVAQVQRHL